MVYVDAHKAAKLIANTYHNKINNIINKNNNIKINSININ